MRVLRRFDAGSRLTLIEKMPLQRGYFVAFTSCPPLLSSRLSIMVVGRKRSREGGWERLQIVGPVSHISAFSLAIVMLTNKEGKYTLVRHQQRVVALKSTSCLYKNVRKIFHNRDISILKPVLKSL